MKPGTYIAHALKYFLRLLLLLVLIYLLIFLVGQARVSAGEFVNELFTTSRGLMLFGALFVLAAFYPLFGFVKRRVDVDMAADRDTIIAAFHAAGYSLGSEVAGQSMTFRASGFRKVVLMWDDKVTVTAGEGYVTLEGIRRETVQVEFRINTFIQNRRNNDED